MSGPKAYVVPESLTRALYRGRLHRLFEVQAGLAGLVHELSSFSFEAPELDVRLSGADRLETFRARLEACATVQDPVGRGTLEELESLSRQIEAVERLQHDLAALRAELLATRDDVTSFRRVRDQAVRELEAFESFRRDVLSRMSGAPEGSEQAAVRDLQVFPPDLRFASGFREDAAGLLQAWRGDVAAARAQVNVQRARLAQRRLAAMAPLPQPDEAAPADVLGARVEGLLEGLSEEDRAPSVQRIRQLGGLEGMSVLAKEEVHDALLEAHRSQSHKASLRALQGELGPLPEDVRVRLSADLAAVLSQPRVKEAYARDFRSAIERERAAVATQQAQARVAAREREFLQRTLTRALEARGYSAVESEVLDLDAGTRLFETPEGEGYVNLQLRDPRTLLYRFLVPEPVQTLDAAQAERHVEEMERSCASFRDVLRELAEMGVALEPRTERPATVDTLLSLPAEQRERLAGTKRRRAGVRVAPTLRKKER